jgi:hypothetical protein
MNEINLSIPISQRSICYHDHLPGRRATQKKNEMFFDLHELGVSA